jgi:hypothetical protein
MDTDTYALLRRAVEERLQVVAWYQGYYRELCPHAIGRAEDGTERVMCYQFGGRGKRPLGGAGSPDNGRCFDIAHLRDVQVRVGEWHTAPNHAHHENCLHTIDTSV